MSLHTAHPRRSRIRRDPPRPDDASGPRTTTRSPESRPPAPGSRSTGVVDAALPHPGARETGPARSARAALSRPWHLAVLTGPDAGLVLPVPAGGTLGRGEVLTDQEASRHHLRMTTTPRAVLIADAGSTNGTRIRRRGMWRRLGRRPARCREGTLLRTGTTVLELRRRPHDLTVPAPPPRPRRRWTQAAMVLTTLALVVVSFVVVRTTGRGAYGALVMAPMALMGLMRLGFLLPTGAGPRRRRPGAGWCGREADAASMLLALAVPARRRPRTGDGDAPLEAWSARRRRADLLELSAGQCTALVGPGAGDAVRWWVVQVLARAGARADAVDHGFRLTWGREGAESVAELLASPDTPPGRARTVLAVPRGAPRLGERWWRATGELAGVSTHNTADSAVPGRVLLEDVAGRVDRDVVAARWRRHLYRGDADLLPAVLGVGPRGPVATDLVGDGPHALMAGTTGSGKSELLTSWLLQLALALPPSRLALVLVDYKGGAAFGPLAHLPHTAGVLTDLEPAATARALASLEAEVRRRERVLARAGAKDVTELAPHLAPPRTLVAVDEFATLAAQHPDVLDALVRVAAQGRSLGIHLLLATQRPTGAVSAAIRANTTLRVCLRVLDVGDSRDVLGHEGAAELEPHPGRVMVAGVRETPHPEVAQAPWCGSGDHLEELVAEIRAAARDGVPAWRPWAPPLPAELDGGAAARLGPGVGPDDGVVLAGTDHPGEQRLGHWRWDVDHPLLVLGSPGSGRTTTALAAARGALDAGRAVSLCLGNAPPAPLVEGGRPVPGVGTIVGPEDPRRLARLWSLAAGGDLAGEVLVVDDADAMAVAVDEVLGPGEGTRLLETLIRNASAAHTGLVLTAPLAAASSRWTGRIGLRLVLGAPQQAQAALAGLPRGVVTGTGPGRGVLVDGAARAEETLACQVVLPHLPHGARERRDHGGQAAQPAHRLLPVPREVAPRAGVWALGGDGALPLPVPGGCVLVVGPPGSGRTTVLAALERCRGDGDGTGPGAGPDTGVLVVDDLDLAGPEEQAAAEEALRVGKAVLASATTERTASTYRGPLATLRERADLVVLWPALGPASQVAGRALRSAVDPRAPALPGRGVLVTRAGVVPLQVAHDTVFATA